MNAAKIDKSDRLRRVDDLLACGKEFSTLDIVSLAGVCAVNSIIAELRANGRTIHCRREDRVYFYRMVVPRRDSAA